jgi:hypothetical protein
LCAASRRDGRTGNVREVQPMFDSLDDSMKRDETISSKEKILRWIGYIAVTLLVLGGLFAGIRMLE